MFGFNSADDTEQDLSDFLTKRGFTVDGTYVSVPSYLREEADSRRFHLDQEKINNMAHVVKFLEQQKHTFE